MEAAKLSEAIEIFNKDNLKQAEEKFRALYAEDKNNAEVNYYLGAIAFQKDYFDEAINFLNKAIELNEQDYRAYEVLGQAYGLKAQNAGMVKGMMVISKAKSSFQKAIELNPKALKAKEGLFMYYLFAPSVAGGDEKKALELIEEIKALNEAKGCVAKAIYYTKDKQIDQAEKEYRKAAELAPSDTDMQMKIGHFYLTKNETEKALEYFNRVIKLKPEDPKAYSCIGDYFLEINKPDSAIEMFNKALDKNNEFYPGRFKRAETLCRLNKKDEAAKDYQYIIDNHSKSALSGKAKAALQKLK